MLKKNLTVKFSEEASNMTRRLARRRGMKPAEIMSESLMLYDYLHKQTLKGNKVVVTRNKKVIKEIEFNK